MPVVEDKVYTHLVVTYSLVVVLGVLVQPHLAQPYAIPLEHVYAASPLVGRAFSKDVTHVRARNYLQSTFQHQNAIKVGVVFRQYEIYLTLEKGFCLATSS